jgi:hypothetical protein
MGFSDGYVEKRIGKNVFFKHINKIIDRTALEKEIDKVYKRGESVDGVVLHIKACCLPSLGRIWCFLNSFENSLQKSSATQ